VDDVDLIQLDATPEATNDDEDIVFEDFARLRVRGTTIVGDANGTSPPVNLLDD